jgi:hypothetical protein
VSVKASPDVNIHPLKVAPQMVTGSVEPSRHPLRTYSRMSATSRIGDRLGRAGERGCGHLTPSTGQPGRNGDRLGRAGEGRVRTRRTRDQLGVAAMVTGSVEPVKGTEGLVSLLPDTKPQW